MDLFKGFNASDNYIQPPKEAIRLDDAPVKRRSGVCAVVGTHPCWEEDLNNFKKKYPDFDVCGVNEAGRLLELDHLATCHGERAEQFMGYCEGQMKLPELHLRCNDVMPEKIIYPYTKWEVRTMAGSAPFAAAVMVLIGYDLVVFVGCPMSGGGGYAFEDTHKSTNYDPRIGYESGQHRMIKTWHRCMRLFQDQFPEHSEKIKSMSGTTQLIFGGIDG